jgi:hypothetical protein
MAIIALPDGKWTSFDLKLSQPAQVNRSEFTGARQVMQLPGAARWMATVEHAPIVGEPSIRPWRAFLAKLRGQANRFNLVAVQGAQRAAQPGFHLAADTIASGISATAGMASFGGNGSWEKTGGGAGWNESVFTSFALPAPSMLSFRPQPSGGEMVIGLRAGANGGAAEAEIDHGLYFDGTSSFRVIESGTTITAAQPFAANDLFCILHLPGSIIYALNGEVITTTAVAAGTQFHFDTSFKSVGTRIDDLGFSSAAGGRRSHRFSGMPLSATFLPAGAFLTIGYDSENAQLVQLTEDLVADAAGSGLATFEAELRGQVFPGRAVVHDWPYAVMAMDSDELGCSVGAGAIYGLSFSCSEAF